MARKEIRDLFDKNVVIHCKTFAEDSAVRNVLHSYAFKWADTSPMTQSFWNEYEDKMCIDPFECRYCHIDYYKNKNRNIISAKEFLTIVDDNRYE